MPTIQGIQFVKKGASIGTSNLRELLLDSRFKMFKFHSDDIRTLTITNGETTALASFPHNLGYVPAFLAYMGDMAGITQMPFRRIWGPPTPGGVTDDHWFAYADATNIYIGWKGNYLAGLQTYYASDYWSTWFGSSGYFTVGRDSGNNPHDGAFRFTDIILNGSDTLIRAKIQIGTDYKEGSTSSVIKFRTWGIDEDNTGSFNNPMGRSKTDAYSSNERTVPYNYGDTVEVDVVSQINEIKARGGWASGNALGFIINENNGATNAEMGSFYAGYGTKLELIKAGDFSYDFRVIVFKDKLHA
jgi:hypothetical protein